MSQFISKKNWIFLKLKDKNLLFQNIFCLEVIKENVILLFDLIELLCRGLSLYDRRSIMILIERICYKKYAKWNKVQWFLYLYSRTEFNLNSLFYLRSITEQLTSDWFGFNPTSKSGVNFGSGGGQVVSALTSFQKIRVWILLKSTIFIV